MTKKQMIEKIQQRELELRQCRKTSERLYGRDSEQYLKDCDVWLEVYLLMMEFDIDQLIDKEV